MSFCWMVTRFPWIAMSFTCPNIPTKKYSQASWRARRACGVIRAILGLEQRVNDLTDESLKGDLSDQKFRRFLILSDLSKGDSPGTELTWTSNLSDWTTLGPFPITSDHPWVCLDPHHVFLFFFIGFIFDENKKVMIFLWTRPICNVYMVYTPGYPGWVTVEPIIWTRLWIILDSHWSTPGVDQWESFMSYV